MKEIYKVRQITISILDENTHEIVKEVSCDFGIIKEKEGILFLETHIFKDDDFAFFNHDTLGCLASAKMKSFNGIEIEAHQMAFVEMKTDECTVTFRCFSYITVKEEDRYYKYQKSIENKLLPNHLLRIDLWGLDLLVKANHNTQLVVANVPFEMHIDKDTQNDVMYAQFSYNEEFTHNILTVDLFDLFRNSFVGYLSLINGARVQIVKEYFNAFVRIYSYNRIENITRSYYTCGYTKLYPLSPILFEFDNYVRWSKVLNLNKFVHHLCTAQQVLDFEDRSFILILAFEGLCKQYLELQKDKVLHKIIPQHSFEQLKSKFLKTLNEYSDIDTESSNKIKDGINRLNDTNLATYKFRLILEDLKIEQTKEIKKLIKNVRSTLVHEAKLQEYADYQLLSELIREIILRIINSKVRRHSYFATKVFIGDPPNLSYADYIKKYKLSIDEPAIISEYDERIRLRCFENPVKS